VKRRKWVTVVGAIYDRIQDAEARAVELRSSFPDHEFRTWGHALSGFGVLWRENM
jgi:hypothetical protein